MSSRFQRSFFIIMLLVAPAFGQWHLEAVLNGANETPPVPSAATGFGYFTLNRPANTITYYLSVSGVSGTVAHIHVGASGVGPGPVLQPLNGGPTVYEGTTAALSSADVVTLLNEGLYANVHSNAFPGGEIRGQLIPVRRTYLTATINGASETPPNASTATGFARVRLNEPENKLIYDVTYTGVVSIAAHIHTGAPGVPGPVLIPLVGGNGHYCGISQTLTSAEVTTLKSNGMYVNIHSGALPNGEIRGQLNQQIQPFTAILNGADETPPNASTSVGTGRADYNPATNTVSYTVNITPLVSGYLVSHVHRGVFGQAGPVVFALSGGPTSFSGTSPALSATQVADFFKGNMYFNIHSNSLSGGEIRGQIRPDAYVFGYGGQGTNGKTRFDAAGYNPPSSDNVTLSLTNAVPGASVLLFIATSTTFSTTLGAPLPAIVPPFGTLWIDASLSFYLPLTADSTGCASIVVSVPTDPALDFFKAYAQCASSDPINGPMLVLSDALELTIL